MTTIRNVIINKRGQDLKKEEPRSQSDEWYANLAKELINGNHGRQLVYSKILSETKNEVVKVQP
jgi:hypothetical protein